MIKDHEKKIAGRYHIITIGCQMNIADSERLASRLEKSGYQLSPDPEQADLLVINTCGVRQMAEDRVYGLVERYRAAAGPEMKIVIMGCLSRRPDVQERLANRVDLFLPTSEMTRLPKILSAKEFAPEFSLDSVRLREGEKYLSLPPKRRPGMIAYIPIGNGCNNFCSYCVVPYARGREVYRPAEEVLAECRRVLKDGYKEIMLVAQNVNSYRDGAWDFPKLLGTVASLPGEFWVSFASSHPKDMSAALIKAVGRFPKICPHVHLAVQSGDDDVLEAMNRRYTAAHFEDLVAKLRKARPGIAITTDVIVGFPGETRKQFDNTRKLFRRVRFDLAYIARYSPRPGTVSATTMTDNVSLEEKKRRERELDEVLKRYALLNNRRYQGQEIEFLVEGIDKKGRYYGKAGTYQTVVAVPAGRADRKLIGTFSKAKIGKIMPFCLEGQLVS